MATKMNGYIGGRVRQNTSPNTHFGLRAVKTYDNTESRVGRKEDPQEATNGDAEGCKKEGQHPADRLWSEGCEDRLQRQVYDAQYAGRHHWDK